MRIRIAHTVLALVAIIHGESYQKHIVIVHRPAVKRSKSH